MFSDSPVWGLWLTHFPAAVGIREAKSVSFSEPFLGPGHRSEKVKSNAVTHFCFCFLMFLLI